MKSSILQRMQQRNRVIITELHEYIDYLRNKKRIADENGNIFEEYQYHNELVKMRKEMKAYVEDQKAIKEMLKGLR